MPTGLRAGTRKIRLKAHTGLGTCGALAGAWVHCCENADVSLRAGGTGLARRPPAQVLVKVPEAEKNEAEWDTKPKDSCIC